MTAINMTIQPSARAGFLITDSAVTDEAGKLLEICGKVIFGTGKFPWAMAISGSVHPHDVTQAAGMIGPTNYKQLVKRLPDIVSIALDLAAAKGAIVKPHLLLIGVAWSQREKRPVGFSIASHADILPDGMTPLTVYEMKWVTTGLELGSPSDQVGRQVDIMDPASFDPAVDGLALIQKQRSAGVRCPVEGVADVQSRIGGEVHLTKISKRGVSTFAIHDFQDVVGEMINPAQCGDLPSSMN